MPLNKFHKEYLYFSEGVKNNIMENSKFYRISYSNENISLKTLIFELQLTFLEPVKHNMFSNRSIQIENTLKNSEIIDKIVGIEKDILQLFFTGPKKPKFSIKDLFSKHTLKLDNPNNLHIKISGIWETDTEYGITYRLHNFENLKRRKLSFRDQAY